VLNQAEPAEMIAHLDALATELKRLGWPSRIDAPRGRRPSLYACNPEPGAAMLSEHVYAQRHDDGSWRYWWPWAEPIAADSAQAAAVIVRVLRTAGVP